MIARVGRLVIAEGIKLWAQPFLYVALALIALGTIGGEELFAFTQGRKASAWGTLHAVQLFASGWGFGHTLATFVLVIFSSMFFAGEFDRGTIKVLLTRPVTRTELFLAKALTTLIIAVALFAFTVWLAAVWALGRGTLGPVWDDTVYYVHQSGQTIQGHAIRALGVAALSYVAAGFLGLLVSTWTESSGFAVAIALVLFLFGWLGTGFVGGEGAKENLFFHYGPYAAEKLKELAGGGSTRWSPRIVDHNLHIKVPLFYILAFVPAAYGLFRFKNIHA
jgi:ABC-2 type transport system permease protein